MLRQEEQNTLLHKLASSEAARLLQNVVFNYLDLSDFEAISRAFPLLGRQLYSYTYSGKHVAFNWSTQLKLPEANFVRARFVTCHLDEAAWAAPANLYDEKELKEYKTGRCTLINKVIANDYTMVAAHITAHTTSLRFWYDRDLERYTDIHEAHGKLTDMMFYGQYLYTACAQGFIKVWDRHTTCVAQIELKKTNIRRIQVNENHIFILTNSLKLLIYSRQRKQTLYEFKIDSHGTTSDMLLVGNNKLSLLINQTTHSTLIEFDIDKLTFINHTNLPGNATNIIANHAFYFIQYEACIRYIHRPSMTLMDDTFDGMGRIIKVDINNSHLHIICNENELYILALNTIQPFNEQISMQSLTNPSRRVIPGPILTACQQGDKLITFTKRGLRMVFEGNSVTLPTPLLAAIESKLSALSQTPIGDGSHADTIIQRYIHDYGYSHTLANESRIGRQLSREYPDKAWDAFKIELQGERNLSSIAINASIESIKAFSSERLKSRFTLFVLAHREREQAFLRALDYVQDLPELKQLIESQLNRYHRDASALPASLAGKAGIQYSLGRQMHHRTRGIGGYYHFLKKCEMVINECLINSGENEMKQISPR
tara:strand:+ start:146 stop:1945 length:1800 start_codon:yes stop_codon:yes gene_type:complete